MRLNCTKDVFMLKKLLAPLLASFLSFVAVGAAAAPQDSATPDGLIKFVVADVMSAVKADKEIQAGNVPKIIGLVDQKIVPYTNFQKTTQLVMGRAWPQASPQQQAQITEEFKKLLVRTYAGAISQIRDQTVQFRPFRAAPEDTDVVVRTQVINNGEPIQLDYRLEKTASGWKVYDINVLGAWLIEAYRSQFSQMISQQGIDGLLKFLQDRNRQLAAAKS
jgi:phospholipid transport system substrate-binding protein